MLEGSLDSVNTVSEVTTVTCRCDVTGNCAIRDCQCETYCGMFYKVYDNIVKSRTYCWFTHNPKPNQLREELQTNYEEELLSEIYSMLKRNKAVGEFILVPELTEAGRVHFHALIEVLDKVKFYKTFVAVYYWKGINKVIMNQKPKLGIHYLFKVSEFMQAYMGSANTVLTRDVSMYFGSTDTDSSVSD